MPDVDVLDTTNGHHEEPDDSSPLDDTLPPLGVSTSDGAGESTGTLGRQSLPVLITVSEPLSRKLEDPKTSQLAS